jgi:chemotaxis protein CheD
MTKPRATKADTDLPVVPIGQGDVSFTAEPSVLTTILGSCVAVCLWDVEKGIGGMNHFVLPYDRSETHSARFGTVAMRELIQGLLQTGARLQRLHAKIFGGANVLSYDARGTTIGAENVHVALACLKEHHIPVVARRTGGNHGLSIRFVTSTGEVLARPIAAKPMHR